ncbi:MAG: flagellar motor protein MotB [Halieaceae bacterium]|jgi:chemotaxis protein MotB|nr:flagellar motor protein MotB [Halieaceae bacterium]
MASDNDDDAPPGSPAWMATFADLMSLLMCFFVLLLSFSEMDVEKFKQIAGSMANAFGVQSQIQLDDIPKGTSVIALEFSPGETVDTPVETIQQVTDDSYDSTLEVVRAEEMTDTELREVLEEKMNELLAETEADAELLREVLREEIETGKVDVESEGRVIVVRIRERGSFPSGSAELAGDFLPALDRIRNALGEIPGTIVVQGHTDNVPLRGGRYESNWGLAASRALSVTHELIDSGELEEERIMLAGFADTRPFTSNDTAEGRAMNRRVEIVIRQGLDEADEEDLRALREANPDALKLLGIEQ